MPINPAISENKLHIICRVLTVYEMLAHLIFTTTLKEGMVHAPLSDEGPAREEPAFEPQLLGQSLYPTTRLSHL